MKYNEIERLQQLAGIITEIKINNPNIKKIDARILDDDGENKDIEYPDVDLNASIYEEDNHALSLFNFSDVGGEVDYYKLTDFLKKNRITYTEEEDREIKFVLIPLENINFIE